jgi:dipeptidyl aminopeptidase/acylaminoacyl peptidase
MDYVSLQQGEEFFTALYRLGKRAKFVRYWGEGHVIASPANTRDMWDNILAWLDTNLRSSPPRST